MWGELSIECGASCFRSSCFGASCQWGELSVILVHNPTTVRIVTIVPKDAFISL